MADQKELVVRIPVELHAQVRERAEREERSISQTVRWALRLYLRTPNGDTPEGDPS